jgi:predicted alpha/beta-fold hydrolase
MEVPELRSHSQAEREAGAAAQPPALSEIARALAERPFRPHPLFRGGHSQTLAGYAWPRSRALSRQARDESRLFEVEPGVRVLARCRWQGRPQSSPTLLLVHGLEGSSESVYMLGTADKAYRAGFNVLRMNIRGCGGTQHLTPTTYHSGLTQDIGAILRELRERDRLAELYLAGFSLGGNQSLKFAGEAGAGAHDLLRAVCAVSPSVDLSASAAAIERRANLVYNRQFLTSLKRRVREASRLYPDRYDTAGLSRVRTIREFDERFTSRHFGFAGADDYYRRASALPFIPRIRIPALILHAQDDPFIPFAPFREARVEANPNVLLLGPRHGGHVGFVAADARGEDRFWAENRVVQFCALVSRGAADGPREAPGRP